MAGDMTNVVQQAQDLMTVKRVFGEPIQQNGLTVVPAAFIRGGGGGGTGVNPQDGTDGSGGGFGVIARPVGVYVIRGDQVEWQPAIDTTRLITAGAALAGLAILTVRTAIRKKRRD
ncbi:MAG: sporulation protein [Actinomycetota bacterium]